MNSGERARTVCTVEARRFAVSLRKQMMTVTDCSCSAEKSSELHTEGRPSGMARTNCSSGIPASVFREWDDRTRAFKLGKRTGDGANGVRSTGWRDLDWPSWPCQGRKRDEADDQRQHQQRQTPARQPQQRHLAACSTISRSKPVCRPQRQRPRCSPAVERCGDGLFFTSPKAVQRPPKTALTRWARLLGEPHDSLARAGRVVAGGDGV